MVHFPVFRETDRVLNLTGEDGKGHQYHDGKEGTNPSNKGVFPYLEVSTEPSLRCTLITLCLLSPIPLASEPKGDILSITGGYRINFQTGEKRGTIDVNLEKTFPVIESADL